MTTSKIVTRGLMILSLVPFAARAAAAAETPAPKSPVVKAAEKAAAKTPSKVAGIRTVFLPSPSSPLCAIRLFFQVGSVDDPKGKQGLAALTAEIVGRGGSKSRTYPELLDA